MSQNLLRLWCWSVRVYAVLCIAVMIATWTFHAVHPEYQGIPRWLFTFIDLPAFGIEILPVILLIDVVLAVTRIYARRTFIMQAILLVMAWCCCLEGLWQSAAPQPKFGITVRGEFSARVRDAGRATH